MNQPVSKKRKMHILLEDTLRHDHQATLRGPEFIYYFQHMSAILALPLPSGSLFILQEEEIGGVSQPTLRKCLFGIQACRDLRPHLHFPRARPVFLPAQAPGVKQGLRWSRNSSEPHNSLYINPSKWYVCLPWWVEMQLVFSLPLLLEHLILQ